MTTPHTEPAEQRLGRLFSPDSMMWRVTREHCILLDGPAAAVLQICHPAVAAGVDQFSSFRTSPLGRLFRTLDVVYTIAFGTRDQVERVRRRVIRMHQGIHGQIPDGPGGGIAYEALDPELLLWVLATLVMSSVTGYERGVAKLSREQRQQLLDDFRIFGSVFGLPPEYGPQEWEAFERYYRGWLHDERMATHPLSAQVARQILFPRSPWYLRLTSPILGHLFAELLPPIARQRLGLRSARRARLILWMADLGLAALVRFTPGPLRYVRAARRAARHTLVASP